MDNTEKYVRNRLFDDEYESLKDTAVNRVISAYQFSQSLGLGKLYVAFSGGKDSVSIYGVCKLAAEKLNIDLLDMCEFHYNITTVDPPELVQFIKTEFPFVHRDRPKKTMWQLIVEKKIPPTRLRRYCCAELKERGGTGKFCVTGVRWAESARRKNSRGAFENMTSNIKNKRILFEDNDEDRRMMEHCIPKQKYICNPIVDWSDDMVWEFIKNENLPYCKLYNEGIKRIGCIGCPMASNTEKKKEFSRYPKFKEQYIRTFNRMLENRRNAGMPCTWKTGEEVMDWWCDEKAKQETPDNPIWEEEK